MMRLGDLAVGRDNHFNLIRMMAAIAVLVSHAWPVTLGKGAIEPLQTATDHSLGTWAVFAFFALSGYLVTASLDRAHGTVDFIRARLLRIIPALAVSSWLVALVMGPLVTPMTWADYLRHPQVWEFTLRNSVPVSHLFDLPGVFTTNPYPHPVGSIWTLPYEMACYAGLLALGWLRRPVHLVGCLMAYLALWLWAEAGHLPVSPRVDALRLLSMPFLLGMMFHRFRRQIPIRGKAAVCLLAGAVALPASLHGTVLYDPALCLSITYAVLWFGHLPALWLHGFRRLGDYSYGTYLYAFPIQGLAVWSWGQMTPALNIALSLPPTLFCAVLSWHLVERPALRLRHQPRVIGEGKRV